MKTEIKTAISAKLIPTIWGALAFLLLQLFSFIVKALPADYIKQIKSVPLLIPLGISILIIVILVVVLALLLKEKHLITRDGVYWDDDGNAHCPSCKIPVTIMSYDNEQDWTYYNCVKCGVKKMNGHHTPNKK